MSFEPLYKLQRSRPEPHAKLLLIDPAGQVYLQKLNDDQLSIPEVGAVPELLQSELPELGKLDGQPCYGCRWESASMPTSDLICADVREIIVQVDNGVKALLLRGKPILEWLHLSRRCSVCGCELEDHEQEEARCCPDCKRLFFPKISPAVIVLIKRDDGRILLARNRKFRHRVYSLIAGFVEAGESAEDAVRREVREEVGLEIKNIRYKCSQSWPFPDSLMLGFTADYAAGTVEPDGDEIVEADFYPPDALPPLPGHGSIARRIIEDYITEFNRR